MTQRARRLVLVQAGLGAGGTEKNVAMIAAHRARHGDRVLILAFAGNAAAPYYPVPEGVEIRSLADEAGPRRPGTAARISWLRARIRAENPDLAISFLTKINIQCALACAGLGVARIASERNNFHVQPMHPLWRLALPAALASADRAVMQTTGARAALPRWAQTRAVVIGNACLTAAAPPPPRRIVAVGRLTEQKGFDLLLDAVAEARATEPGLALTIWGEGEDRQRLETRRAVLGLEDAVAMPGNTERPHGWIGTGDIFVLSSRYEGFANVLVEAMSAGMAVVSFACDWSPADILTDGQDGLLVPAGDISALAGALLRLWRDETLRRRLAEAARKRAQEFTEARILAEWDRVIAETVPAPGSARLPFSDGARLQSR